MALAAEEEERYRPSKYKFWFNVMLQHIPTETTKESENTSNQSYKSKTTPKYIYFVLNHTIYQ